MLPGPASKASIVPPEPNCTWPATRLVRPAVLRNPQPSQRMPLGLAMTISARWPATSIVPRSRLASVPTTSLRMMRAGVSPICRLPVIQPPCWVSTLPVLLFRMSPLAPTLNCWYWLRLTPPTFGGAMCTMGTPLAAASISGFWPAGAPGAAVTCAHAGPVASTVWSVNNARKRRAARSRPGRRVGFMRRS